MSRDLVGAWRLLSCEIRRADGKVWYLYDVGYLIYSASGHMAVVLTQRDTPLFASGDLRLASVEEKSGAFDAVISYAGTYEVKGQTLYHHVEVSSFPNWVGVTLERTIRITGDRLTISTAPTLIDGEQQTAHLIFERVP